MARGREVPFTTNLATAFVPLDDPRAVISVTLEAPQPSSRGIHPRAAFPSPSRLRSQARGAFTLERRFRHPRGSAAKLEGHSPSSGVSVTLEAPQPSSRGGIHPRVAFPSGSRLGKLELAIQARSAWSKRLVQAPKLCPTSTFNLTRFEVQFKFLEFEPCQSVDLCTAHGALTGCQRRARAACRRPASSEPTSDMAGCPRSRCTPLARSHGRKRTVALTQRPPSRRRRGPPGFAVAAVARRSKARLLRPRVLLFPRPVSSRLAHARLPPAARLRARVDAAHGANTAATSRCRRETSPSCPGLHLVIPEHPSTPLSLLLKPSTVPLPQHAGKTSPELAEPPPSLLSWAALAVASPLPHPPLPLTEPFPTRFPHQSRWRSSPELTELSAAAAHVHSPLYSSSSRTEGTIRFLHLRPRHRRSPLAGASRAATAVADLDSGHPRPRDLAQTNHGEPLSISPHFPGPVSPPFGRRNHAGEPRDLTAAKYSGLADGVYELVPAAEEIAQESEVNVVHVDPSPEQEYRFEPEGKPRSIT
nr:unnamed protein product [Digitaria exilis]